MNRKHTPGPWRVVEGMLRFVMDARDRAICEIAHSRDFTKPAPDGAANARLIAAAPDLLEALEACLDDDYAFNSRTKDRAAALIDAKHNARVAIAKARGEG